MNTKQLAEMLDGIEYPADRAITKETKNQAKEDGLVIVYGGSDDLTEFDGAIYDERSAWEGAKHWVVGTGLYPANRCDDERCPNYERPSTNNAVPLKAIWCGPSGASWEFDFPVAHETFKVMEDGEVYCYGIVFSLADVAAYLEAKP